ncbi:MAG: hypothetical protein J6P98_04235, partial [Clostridia bacterium]|nr:hypothetical protein [Clostridia bacterium]
MKKTLVFITLLALIAVAAAGCAGSRAEQGPALSHNVARIWFPAERISRFALDGKVIEGEVTGQAFMDASADGRTSIAWVDTTPYFVSESGVDQLGAGIDVAVVSFDGRYAVYLTEGELRMFSVETRDCTVLMEGVASAQQIAVSPKSESVLFTVSLEGEGVTRKTFLYTGGSVQEVYEGRGVIAIAVSDDASVRYFYDFKAGAFCADVSGEERVISEKCDNSTNYNFTNDLSEVAFRDTEGENHWYRLRDGRMTDLGGGF